MTNYIIPVFGQCQTPGGRWAFAFKALGYKMPKFRSLTVSEPTTICATSKSGDVENTLQKNDEVLVITTDAPQDIIESFWSMTGDVCDFIGILDCGEVNRVDDLANCKIHRIH